MGEKFLGMEKNNNRKRQKMVLAADVTGGFDRILQCWQHNVTASYEIFFKAIERFVFSRPN